MSTDMKEYKVQMEEREIREEKFIPCTKTNLALMVCTLLLLGCAATVLLMKPGNQSQQQQDGHFEELRHSLRQTDVRAAIHLDGKYQETSKTVQWQLDTDQSYAAGGLTLVKNEIVVPHSGPYFVYSQASYRVNCNSDPEEQQEYSLVHLSHVVERWTDSMSSGEEQETEYRPILHAVRTACERHPQRGHWFSGVYVGAMFNLKTGDRLRTSLTKDPQLLSQLEDGHGETFFGVFAL
ncbi:tumor necrosis factor a (TNF superfamily, member 2) [Eucyclogobius newberryi]|uniref:tumor necrosis factor a (TNF superfamily, member 2) n=1 Tax=Eucyclogobius newberryi TaxID=166745 RepID=UPI003B591CD8